MTTRQSERAAAEFGRRYRTQWLLNIHDNPDKTFPTHGSYEVYIVESWESPDSFPKTVGNKTRSIHAYTNADAVELMVNGASQGLRTVVPMVKGPGSYAEWTAVPWAAGVLTAVAKVGNKTVATTQRHTNGKPATLQLSLDAPSAATGTGTAVVLDGHDAALLRGSILDSNGRVMHLATNNITFRVVSGPGAIQGCGNGDPHAHWSNAAPWHPAYHGLVRAVVRVSSAAARPLAERALIGQIDADGPLAAAAEQQPAAATPIVVEATSPGFAPARISIPTSLDLAKDGVLATAAKAAGKPVDFF